MQKVTEFVDGEYFSHVESTLSVSTVDGYRKLWTAYKKHFDGLELEALLTCNCQGLLRTIVRQNPHLTKTTVRHIKNFFSGVWSHALRMGVTKLGNPWRDVSLPLAQEPGETHAYAPEEIECMLVELNGQAKLAVLLAACTGLRKSEIRGLTWADWRPETSTLEVRRAVWRRHTKTTKSKASKAPVPVVPVLAKALNEYYQDLRVHTTSGDVRECIAGNHEQCTDSPRDPSKFIFTSTAGTSLDLDNLARRVIMPAIDGHCKWHGWHAFRRGLATFLHANDVDDMTIKEILRHENVAVTQKCYVKTVPESVRNAMANVRFGEGK